MHFYRKAVRRPRFAFPDVAGKDQTQVLIRRNREKSVFVRIKAFSAGSSFKNFAVCGGSVGLKTDFIVLLSRN